MGKGLGIVLALALLGAALFAGMAPAKKSKPGKDPFAAEQWALDEIDGRDPLTLMRRDPATIPLGVVDTGVGLTHRDLRARLWRNPSDGTPGWDSVGTSGPPNVAPDADPTDLAGHGTLVAGIAAAATHNKVGISGVAPNAQVMAIRGCWTPGECYDEPASAAIRWAADHGARVANLSFDARNGTAEITDAIASHPEVLFVAPAGNATSDLDLPVFDFFPCELPPPNLICVAATAQGGTLGSCSSYGQETVDVAAPGVGLVSTSLDGVYHHNIVCATSLAAPHVAGLAALLLGAVPEANTQQVKDAILSTVTRTPSLDNRVASDGLINVPRALQQLQDQFGIPLPPETQIREARFSGHDADFELRARGAKSRGFQCAVDEDPWRRCSRVNNLSGLKRGRHKLRARALGARRTVDPTPATRKFRVRG